MFYQSYLFSVYLRLLVKPSDDMDFRGSLLLLSIALVAFSGTKSILAQEHDIQPEIEKNGRNTSLPAADEHNKNLNTVKETAEHSDVKDTSPIHEGNSQGSSEKKRASGSAADDINRNTTGEASQIKSAKGSILNNTVKENQERVAPETKLTGHQIISPESHWNHDHISGRGGAHTYSQPPEVTAMLAGIFVLFAVLGYFGLVCWRRSLERKYGNREMLVDEEEFSSEE